jgi:hypothetical protein
MAARERKKKNNSHLNRDMAKITSLPTMYFPLCLTGQASFPCLLSPHRQRSGHPLSFLFADCIYEHHIQAIVPTVGYRDFHSPASLPLATRYRPSRSGHPLSCPSTACLYVRPFPVKIPTISNPVVHSLTSQSIASTSAISPQLPLVPRGPDYLALVARIVLLHHLSSILDVGG